MSVFASYLSDHLHPLCNQVGRIESYPKLTNHGNISSSLEAKDRYWIIPTSCTIPLVCAVNSEARVSAKYLKRFHELPGSRASNRTQVVDQVRLRHSASRIPDGQRVFFLVGYDYDLQLFLLLKNLGFRQAFVPNLVQSLELTHIHTTELIRAVLQWCACALLTSEELEMISRKKISLLE